MVRCISLRKMQYNGQHIVNEIEFKLKIYPYICLYIVQSNNQPNKQGIAWYWSHIYRLICIICIKRGKF